ncbi:MAG: hypothetical protein LBG77_02955 [Dysgonamonadaceae bacterium]|jgi:hypothetical protein|nr:hypothetical protein [Dysgonamonadaceae bacterium]
MGKVLLIIFCVIAGLIILMKLGKINMLWTLRRAYGKNICTRFRGGKLVVDWNTVVAEFERFEATRKLLKMNREQYIESLKFL